MYVIAGGCAPTRGIAGQQVVESQSSGDVSIVEHQDDDCGDDDDDDNLEED